MKKNKKKSDPLYWQEVMMNVGNPVWDKKEGKWRVINGYKRINDSFYVSFTDCVNWEFYKSTELYSERID